MRELADGLAEAVRPLCDMPLALFGHSLGAAVAYEVALRLKQSVMLFVSGCAPPHVHMAREKRVWDEESVIQDLKRLGGTNNSALDNTGLLSLLLPALCADYNLGEKYVPTSDARLSCAVVGFHGAQDKEVTFDEMSEWSAVTTGPFSMRVFEGDHFFPLRRSGEVVSEIVSTISKLS
jgi:surfactin synthase thioesterase subunit